MICCRTHPLDRLPRAAFYLATGSGIIFKGASRSSWVNSLLLKGSIKSHELTSDLVAGMFIVNVTLQAWHNITARSSSSYRLPLAYRLPQLLVTSPCRTLPVTNAFDPLTGTLYPLTGTTYPPTATIYPLTETLYPLTETIYPLTGTIYLLR